MPSHLSRTSKAHGHRRAVFRALLAACATLPHVAFANESSSTDEPNLRREERGRLTLAAGLGIAGIGHRAKASVFGETLLFDPPDRGQPPEPSFEPFGDSSKRDLIKGAIALSAQLAGPTLESIPGAPRVFVDAGLYVPLDGRVTIASAEGIGPQTVKEPVIYADARFHWRWFVGVGVEFVAPQPGWSLVVRPSVDYVGQSLTVRGVFEEEIWPRPLPRVQLERTASDSLTHHGVGGRLALEAEMRERGTWIPTLFLEAQAAYLFGDFDGSLDVLGTNWLTRYDYDFERVAAAVSAGFRLKWRGF